MRYFKLLFLLVMGIQVLALSGCGGGGSSSGGQPTTVIVKVATATDATFTAGTLITGITTTLKYPTNNGLTVSNVVASGVGSGSAVDTNTTINGQVLIGLLSTPGIQPGEFATITFSVTPGFPSVSAADFSIASGASIIDLSGPITGISVVKQSVTIQ
jgi:hypothetical protein